MSFIVNEKATLAGFTKNLLVAIDRMVSDDFQAVVTNILEDLSANTPQWSGDLAASWQVSVDGRLDPGFLSPSGLKHDDWGEFIASGAKSQWIGSRPAVDQTLAQNAPIIKTVHWTSKVVIHNSNPTIEPITEDESYLRHGNYIPGDVMAIKYVHQKYNLKV